MQPSWQRVSVSPSSWGGSQVRPGHFPTRAGSATRSGRGGGRPGPGVGWFLGVTTAACGMSSIGASSLEQNAHLCFVCHVCVCVHSLLSLRHRGGCPGPLCHQGSLLSSQFLTAGEASASQGEETAPHWLAPPQKSSVDEERTGGGIGVQGCVRHFCALQQEPKGSS